jgi:PAS domain S-box-containing protein
MMSNPQAPDPGQGVDEEATRGRGLRRKLFHSHMVLSAIGAGLLLVAFVSTLQMRSSTLRLARERGPMVRASTLALAGVERSLAGLRGWMALGDPAFAQDRARAWTDEIGPAIDELEKISSQSEGSDDMARLDQLRRLLEDLREEQWWIEDVAQMPGNQPARRMLVEDIQPIAGVIFGAVTSMIELEKASPSRQQDNVLGLLADFRGFFTRADTALSAFVHAPDDVLENDFRSDLGVATQRVSALQTRAAALSPEQRELFNSIQAEIAVYELLATEVIAIRESKKSNVAHHLMATAAVPLARQVSELLRSFSAEQTRRMHADARRASTVANAALGLLIALIAVMVVAAWFVSKRAAERIALPIAALSVATRKLAEGRLTQDIPVTTDDEIGQLTTSFNAMRAALMESRQGLQKLSRAVEQSPSSVVITDMEGRIEYVNSKFAKVTGYTREEAIGKNPRILKSGEQPPKFYKNLWDTITAGREWSGSFCNRKKNGTLYWEAASISPVRNPEGEITHFVAVKEDITERRRVAEELRQAKEAADTANQAKSDFLASMSHELRTPMNAIIGYSEMLMEEAEDLEQDEFTPDLQKINSAGRHLLALINDILDLSKIEAGKMELFLETFDIAPMIQDVSATVDPLLHKNDNSLQIACSDDIGSMCADLTKVRQLLFNLLSNAAKFTHNGTVTLSTEREQAAGGDFVVFKVADTGIGVAADKLDKVFMEFTQADSSTTKEYGGTGLGLSISRKFCQMMGGGITVESTLGEGTTFTIRLPRDVQPEPVPVASANQPATTTEDRPASPGRRTILVIDDEPQSRELIERMLIKDGFDVITADSGERGLELARELRPSAITLDVMMPSMDGWEVLRELQADPSVRNIPVVMISMIDDASMGYALGATEYLTKPVDRARLSQVLDRYRCANPPCPVLVVDDDEEVREMFRRALEKQGWQVAEAENGRDALDRMRQRVPELIILDLMMPVMDGFDFLLELRKVADWQRIPVVVVTAKDLSGEDRRRLTGKVEKVVQKGAYDREKLLEQIRELVTTCGPPDSPEGDGNPA